MLVMFYFGYVPVISFIYMYMYMYMYICTCANVHLCMSLYFADIKLFFFCGYETTICACKTVRRQFYDATQRTHTHGKLGSATEIGILETTSDTPPHLPFAVIIFIICNLFYDSRSRNSLVNFI